jgi:hypothetical protein|tara:strand:+ start:332 stop:580 length:249 start_codon:yes stop_codon:yes gene_type:complete
MSFIETEASIRYEVIDGKEVPVVTPKCEVTLTNTETGKEYNSDAEALADVQNVNTDTKPEHIRRDVHLTVASFDLGAKTNIF